MKRAKRALHFASGKSQTQYRKYPEMLRISQPQPSPTDGRRGATETAVDRRYFSEYCGGRGGIRKVIVKERTHGGGFHAQASLKKPRKSAPLDK
jgi:hypothetical protein